MISSPVLAAVAQTARTFSRKTRDARPLACVSSARDLADGGNAAPLIAAYPHATDREAHQARLDFERDLRFRWDMWAWARLQAKTGHSAVYYYSFTQQPPGWGASHFAELWYVFDHLDQAPWKPSQSDHHLATTMSDYWVNFVRTGNPNGTGLPQWRPLVGDTGPVQYLGQTVASGSLSDLGQLKVFDEVYSSLRH